jgi:sugar lactone lactonase YvrE
MRPKNSARRWMSAIQAAYVNSLNFDFAEFTDTLSSGAAPGKIALVTADGAAREVADGLAFPNGMAVTPDNRTLIVAQWFGPDRMDELIEAKTGRILTAQVAVLHAGWP